MALFRSPVADETILSLARELFRREGQEPMTDDTTLVAELKTLQVHGILTREPIEGGHGSACHPILRDHFRTVLLGTGATTARLRCELARGAAAAFR